MVSLEFVKRPFFKILNTKKEEKRLKKEERELLEQIYNSKKDYDSIKENINSTNDKMMLEHLIFRLKASEIRHRHYLRRARERGIDARHFEDIAAFCEK